MADEEYLTVSFAEGKGHENAMKRMEFATKEYRSIWDKCEGIIRPK
jgi:putative alpha-1,2-mannosidase